MFAVVLGPLPARRHVAAPRGDCRSWSLHGYCACWRTVFHLWWPNGDSFNVTPAVRCWTISLHLFVWKDRFVIPILLVPFKNTRIPVCSNCAPVSVFFSFEQLYCSTNPKEKAAISFAFVRSDTYTCGIAEARESCSVSTDSPSSVIVVDSTDESSSSAEVTSTDAKQATADTHQYVLTPLAFKHPQL